MEENTNTNAQNVNPEAAAPNAEQQPQNEKHFTWKTAVKWTAVVGCVAIIGVCLGKLYKASKATADAVADTVAAFSNMTAEEVAAARKNAEDLSKKALWKQFISHYYEAYDIALRKKISPLN